MNYIDDSVALLASPAFENSIPWMYLDTRGFVTVAAGQLLATAADACALRFQAPDVGLADLDSIIADWKRVKAMEPEHSPSFYHATTSPTMTAADMQELLRVRVKTFDEELAGWFPDWASFPDPAKLALLDMAFNLGMGGLLKYTHLRAAVKLKDWTAVANECHRNGPSEARNEWCKNQFLEAAK